MKRVIFGIAGIVITGIALWLILSGRGEREKYVEEEVKEEIKQEVKKPQRWSYVNTMLFFDLRGNLLWKKIIPWCPTEIRFSPDEDKLLLLTTHDGIFLLDSKTGKELWHVQLGLDYWTAYSKNTTFIAINNLGVSPDFKYFAFVGTSYNPTTQKGLRKEYVFLFDINGRKLYQRLIDEYQNDINYPFKNKVGRLLFLKNENKLVIFNRGKGISIFKIKEVRE